MHRLEIMAAARGDLDRFRQGHRRAVSRILVRLQEIAADPSQLARLLATGSGGDRWSDVFYVGEWEDQLHHGRRLRYLKFWEIENIGERFRIVYAHNPTTDVVHVLGIAPRDFNYDPNDPFTKRVVADYDKLGCTTDSH